MTQQDIETFKTRFSDYTRSFYSSDPEEQKNISLKVKHTSNVCRISVDIATHEALCGERILLAEASALFHDIGRFPQFAQYKTFRDSISVNHGSLGAKVLEQERFLSDLPAAEQALIINTVRFHNAFGLPELSDPECVLFLKLIRDSDKLDIWRVFLEFYEGSESERASAAGLGLPDEDGFSDEILSCILEGRPASLASLKNLNDFKLLQLSWVFDLNFMRSFSLLSERRYIERYFSLLPDDLRLSKASKILDDFVLQRLR